MAYLLNFNKNTVQRIFQTKGWQVRKRPIGFRPRVQVSLSVAEHPDERRATDVCRVWSGRDCWAALALVIDCCIRELLRWDLSKTDKFRTVESDLEQALISRYSTLGKFPGPFVLRYDNGLVFTSRTRQNKMAWLNGSHQNLERTMPSPKPIQEPAAHKPCHQQLDHVLQH